MKKPLLIIAFLLFACMVKAQKNDTVKSISSDTLIFYKVEHEPEFPGGMKKFYKYVAKNLHYPANMGTIDVQGKVFIQFIVEKDGSVSHVKVTKSLYDDLDKEALRVVSNSPKWNPGVQNGHIVRVLYVVPIDFTVL